MLIQTEEKYVEREGRSSTTIQQNTDLHAESQESECDAILAVSGAGFHHSCVFSETAGTQTDEPMDVSEEKCQELYFVVYILVYMFNIHIYHVA